VVFDAHRPCELRACVRYAKVLERIRLVRMAVRIQRGWRRLVQYVLNTEKQSSKLYRCQLTLICNTVPRVLALRLLVPRYRLARLVLRYKREQRASTKIANMQRKKVAKKEVARRREVKRRNDAALCIQLAWRVRKARLRVRLKRGRRDAWLLLQRWGRGCLGRWRVARIRQANLERKSATMLANKYAGTRRRKFIVWHFFSTAKRNTGIVFSCAVSAHLDYHPDTPCVVLLCVRGRTGIGSTLPSAWWRRGGLRTRPRWSTRLQ